MAARDFDCAAPFEVPQNARDCLNGKAKIIRDIPAGHWQMNEIILSWRCALEHFYEETDDPFFCSRGQEQEKMVLLTSKLAGCQRQQPRLDEANSVNARFLKIRTLALVIASIATLCFFTLSSPKTSSAK